MALQRGQRPDLHPEARRFLLDEPQPVSFWTLRMEVELDRPREPENRLRPIWQQHGETLLKLYIRRNPGRRPRCWWAFSAPEMRAVVRGSATPLPALGFDRGLPLHLATWSGMVFYESQSQFLDRHGLLSPVERRRLGAEDYAPEAFAHWWQSSTYDSVFRSAAPGDVLPFKAPEPPADGFADDGLEP